MKVTLDLYGEVLYNIYREKKETELKMRKCYVCYKEGRETEVSDRDFKLQRQLEFSMAGDDKLFDSLTNGLDLVHCVAPEEYFDRCEGVDETDIEGPVICLGHMGKLLIAVGEGEFD